MCALVLVCVLVKNSNGSNLSLEKLLAKGATFSICIPEGVEGMGGVLLLLPFSRYVPLWMSNGVLISKDDEINVILLISRSGMKALVPSWAPRSAMETYAIALVTN